VNIPVDVLKTSINKRFPFDQTTIPIEFDFNPIKRLMIENEDKTITP